jgi:hypothetical protein
MLMILRKAVLIDDDLSVAEMLEWWKSGEKLKRDTILKKLKDDHPGLTAFFMSEGIRSKVLDECAVNTITNTLLDDRRYTLEKFAP